MIEDPYVFVNAFRILDCDLSPYDVALSQVISALSESGTYWASQQLVG